MTDTPSPPISTSLVYGTLLSFCLSMLPLKYNAATVTPNYEKLTLNQFLSLNVTPQPPIALFLYYDSTHLPQM